MPLTGSLGFGFKVGHYTDAEALTGCTVVLPPAGNVTSCDIRGSSPGSRELVLLDLDRRLTETHGIVLTGGSAFGLASADGVASWLAERGIGYQTPVATVPIVPAAVVFDLGSGDPMTRPGHAEGRAACDAATEAAVASGRVGAGSGTTVGKWAGFEFAAPGGLGFSRAEHGDAAVTALVVVNAVGDIMAADGSVLRGTSAPAAEPKELLPDDKDFPTNTVLALVAVEASLTKQEVRWLAGRGSDGITTVVRPAHTRYDGDVTFAVAAPPRAGSAPANLDILGPLATQAVAAAIRAAVV
ncbi:MAG: peptidase S58 family protein [Actinobacteria bacterium]|nr:peptidase S58 family protein [Actinomycetota bacterium]